MNGSSSTSTSSSTPADAPPPRARGRLEGSGKVTEGGEERERRGLSISDVAARSGLDRAVVSRLENGKQDNPTVATLMRYCAAVGKRFLWTYEDLATKSMDDHGKASGRRARRCP